MTRNSAAMPTGGYLAFPSDGSIHNALVPQVVDVVVDF